MRFHTVDTDKHSVSGRVVGEHRALGCGFDCPSECAIGGPGNQRDDVVADEAQVSQIPIHIAVCADRDDIGWVSMVLVEWGWEAEPPCARTACDPGAPDPTARFSRCVVYTYPDFRVAGALAGSGGRWRRNTPYRGWFAGRGGTRRRRLIYLPVNKDQHKPDNHNHPRDGRRCESPTTQSLRLTWGFAARPPGPTWPAPRREPGLRRRSPAPASEDRSW